jgi:hypothetical protein
MTREASGAQFEIKVAGVVRSYRDFRQTAVEAARFLQQRNPSATIVVTDLRDGSAVPFTWRRPRPADDPVRDWRRKPPLRLANARSNNPPNGTDAA